MTQYDAPERNSTLLLASVVVPLWNGLEHIEECLSSLLQQTYTPLEIIVVDNGSTDGSAEVVERHFETVRLLRNEQNLGFSAACNRGLEAARGEILLLLNQDTIVEPDWVEALARGLDITPDTGIVGSKAFYPDGTIQHAGGYVDEKGGGHHFGHGDPGDPQLDEAREVEFVTGAAIAIRRGVYEAIGGLDEGFGQGYYEDVDWCYRARAAGFKVRYEPTARLVHKEESSLASMDREGMYLPNRNRLRFILKHWPLARLRERFLPAEQEWLQTLTEGGEHLVIALHRAYLYHLLHLRELLPVRRAILGPVDGEQEALAEILITLHGTIPLGPARLYGHLSDGRIVPAARARARRRATSESDSGVEAPPSGGGDTTQEQLSSPGEPPEQAEPADSTDGEAHSTQEEKDAGDTVAGASRPELPDGDRDAPAIEESPSAPVHSTPEVAAAGDPAPQEYPIEQESSGAEEGETSGVREDETTRGTPVAPAPEPPSLSYLRNRPPLQEYRFRSTAPLVGPLVAWIRHLWFQVAARWATRYLMEQQEQVNQEVIRTLTALYERQTELVQWCRRLEAAQAELEARKQALEGEIGSVRERHNTLRSRVRQLERALRRTASREQAIVRSEEVQEAYWQNHNLLHEEEEEDALLLYNQLYNYLTQESFDRQRLGEVLGEYLSQHGRAIAYLARLLAEREPPGDAGDVDH